MGDLRVLAVDPGFASLGWAVVSFTDSGPVCEAAGVLRTAADRTKLKYNDNVDRSRYLYENLKQIADQFGIRIIASEAQSWTRFANADRALAFSFGLLAALGVEIGAPIVQITPQVVKARVCGKKTASKDEVMQAVCRLATGSQDKLEAIRATTQREHAADAIGVALASFEEPLVYGIVSVLGLTKCEQRSASLMKSHTT